MKPALDVVILDNRSEKAMNTGGPGSCKGCVGGISGFLLDQLEEDFGISLPNRLINNRIQKVKFINLLEERRNNHFEIDFSEKNNWKWNAPKNLSVLVSSGNGKGRYNHPDGKNISFDYFLRSKTREMGVEFINGYVNEILIPEDMNDHVKVKFSRKRLKSTLNWFKKTQNGKIVTYPQSQPRGSKEIDDATLVINATGLNSRNRIELFSYRRIEKPMSLRLMPVSLRAKGKIMGIFDIDIEEGYLKKTFGNSLCVYGGIKGANTIVAAPKYMQKGGSWLTIGILLDRDVEPEYDNICEEGNCNTAKPHTFRKEMKSIRDEFMRKSQLDRHIDAQSIKKSTCRCTPIIPHDISGNPHGHRYVEIGDVSGSMKYGRNGIPYAFRAAKRAAEVAIQHGISDEDFKVHYNQSFVDKIRRDNLLGKYVMKLNGLINRYSALADPYYTLAENSPLLKRYAIQILLGIHRSDSYTQSTLNLLRDSYGGGKLLADLGRYYLRNRSFDKLNRSHTPS
jgi:flavin-dependent dehydrogenase